MKCRRKIHFGKIIGHYNRYYIGNNLRCCIFHNKKKKIEEEEIVEPIDEMVIPESVEEIDLELAGSQVKQQIEQLVNKKPDAVAQLLKNWLSED